MGAKDFYKIHNGLNIGFKTADPSSPAEGDTYRNSTSNKVKLYINGAWRELVTDTGTHTLTNKTIGDQLDFAEVAAPATPASGFGRVYSKADGKLYFKNDAGTEFDLTLGSVTYDSVRMVVTGLIAITHTRVDGFHASQDTKTLSKIVITAGQSGSGTTTVVVNRNAAGPSGAGSATASLTGNSASKTTATTLGSPLSLVANDFIDMDITAVSSGLEDLTVELIFT